MNGVEQSSQQRFLSIYLFHQFSLFYWNFFFFPLFLFLWHFQAPPLTISLKVTSLFRSSMTTMTWTGHNLFYGNHISRSHSRSAWIWLRIKTKRTTCTWPDIKSDYILCDIWYEYCGSLAESMHLILFNSNRGVTSVFYRPAGRCIVRHVRCTVTVLTRGRQKDRAGWVQANYHGNMSFPSAYYALERGVQVHVIW